MASEANKKSIGELVQAAFDAQLSAAVQRAESAERRAANIEAATKTKLKVHADVMEALDVEVKRLGIQWTGNAVTTLKAVIEAAGMKPGDVLFRPTWTTRLPVAGDVVDDERGGFMVCRIANYDKPEPIYRRIDAPADAAPVGDMALLGTMSDVNILAGKMKSPIGERRITQLGDEWLVWEPTFDEMASHRLIGKLARHSDALIVARRNSAPADATSGEKPTVKDSLTVPPARLDDEERRILEHQIEVLSTTHAKRKWKRLYSKLIATASEVFGVSGMAGADQVLEAMAVKFKDASGETQDQSGEANKMVGDGPSEGWGNTRIVSRDEATAISGADGAAAKKLRAILDDFAPDRSPLSVIHSQLLALADELELRAQAQGASEATPGASVVSGVSAAPAPPVEEGERYAIEPGQVHIASKREFKPCVDLIDRNDGDIVIAQFSIDHRVEADSTLAYLNGNAPEHAELKRLSDMLDVTIEHHAMPVGGQVALRLARVITVLEDKAKAEHARIRELEQEVELHKSCLQGRAEQVKRLTEEKQDMRQQLAQLRSAQPAQAERHQIALLKDLIKHIWVHANTTYTYEQMTTPQKALFDEITHEDCEAIDAEIEATKLATPAQPAKPEIGKVFPVFVKTTDGQPMTAEKARELSEYLESELGKDRTTPFTVLLKHVRLRDGHGLRAFAERIGLMPSDFAKIQSGRVEPTMDDVAKIIGGLSPAPAVETGEQEATGHEIESGKWRAKPVHSSEWHELEFVKLAGSPGENWVTGATGGQAGDAAVWLNRRAEIEADLAKLKRFGLSKRNPFDEVEALKAQLAAYKRDAELRSRDEEAMQAMREQGIGVHRWFHNAGWEARHDFPGAKYTKSDTVEDPADAILALAHQLSASQDGKEGADAR